VVSHEAGLEWADERAGVSPESPEGSLFHMVRMMMMMMRMMMMMVVVVVVMMIVR
jgi:hypothetical protein